MSAHIQFTDRPVAAINLPISSGFGSGTARAHDLERLMSAPDTQKTEFKVFDPEGRLLCAGLYLGGDNYRDWVLETVRIHAEHVDDVDPIRLEFEDGKAFAYSADMDAVIPE